MEWVFNDSGPFLLLPRSFAAGWNKNGPAQYEAVCEGLDIFKRMDWQGIETLVLETEGGQIAWVDGKEGGCFVVWVYAPPDIPDELVASHALEMPDDGFEEWCEVSLPKQDYVLWPAADIDPKGTHETLQVLLPPGRYMAGVCREMTFVYDEQPAEFYVVKLKRLPQE